eukprot:284815876_6
MAANGEKPGESRFIEVWREASSDIFLRSTSSQAKYFTFVCDPMAATRSIAFESYTTKNMSLSVFITILATALIRTASSETCTAESFIDTDLFDFQFIKIDQHLLLYLRVKKPADFIARIGGEKCWSLNNPGPIAWHVHDKVDFPGAYNLGDTECGGTATGGHWDLTLACGPSSGNELCKKLGIPPSRRRIVLRNYIFQRAGTSTTKRRLPVHCFPIQAHVHLRDRGPWEVQAVVPPGANRRTNLCNGGA